MVTNLTNEISLRADARKAAAPVEDANLLELEVDFPEERSSQAHKCAFTAETPTNIRKWSSGQSKHGLHKSEKETLLHRSKLH